MATAEPSVIRLRPSLRYQTIADRCNYCRSASQCAGHTSPATRRTDGFTHATTLYFITAEISLFSDNLNGWMDFTCHFFLVAEKLCCDCFSNEFLRWLVCSQNRFSAISDCSTNTSIHPKNKNSSFFNRD